MLDISCESSAWQRIHMKHQALFSLKDKSKKIIIVSSAAILLGALRIKLFTTDLHKNFKTTNMAQASIVNI